MNQRIGFVTSNDGTRIAYAVSGDGPGLPVVRVATVSTHVELDQDSVIWGHFWRFLSNGRTLIRYDQRGGGLSDRTPDDYSLDARVEDLEAVVDGVQVAKFNLLGHGFGCLSPSSSPRVTPNECRCWCCSAAPAGDLLAVA